MARINLLPWREEQRRRKNQKYFAQLLALVVATGGSVFVYQQIVESSVQYQRQRNAYLQNETELLQESLVEIHELERTKSHLLSRMQIIHQLQRQRPQVVHLFHELAATIPEGVALLSIEQTDQSLTLKGVSDSNARVSTYMRQIDASDWFSKPTLEGIEVEEGGTNNVFSLQIEQSEPQAKSDFQG